MATNLLDEKLLLDELGRPVLPPGLAWVDKLDNQSNRKEGIYTNEIIRTNVENFGKSVANEIVTELETSPKIRIVVPISGGFVAYNSVLKQLKLKGISPAQLEIVFATSVDSKHDYTLSPNYSGIDMPTFLVDDIYDEGDSFKAIFDLIKVTKFIARYLSTKEGSILPEECIPSDGNIEMDVMRAVWLANPYGMNSNIPEVDILERLSALPIAVTDLSAVQSWEPEHYSIYKEILSSSMCAFYGNASEAEMMTAIYQSIKNYKSLKKQTGSRHHIHDMLIHLDQRVSQTLLAYHGFIS